MEDRLKITKSEWLMHLQTGREIEFSYNEKPYFLTPEYNPTIHRYILYVDAQENRGIKVFVGTPDEILTFKFEGICSINDDVTKFTIDYIL